MKSKKSFTEMTFQEAGKAGKEILSRQSPVSLEKARAQVKRLEMQSKLKHKEGIN